MMKTKKMWKTVALAALLCTLSAGSLQAAGNKPVDLQADTIEYNSQSGIVTANGNVVMIQEGSRMTGAAAVYNSKTEEGRVTGGVVADKDGMHMTADTVVSDGKNHLHAEGNVVAVKEDKTITGPVVEYYTDRNYAVIPSNGKIVTQDGFVTADHMEADLTADHLIGTGNAHVFSQTRNMEAFGDQLDYYGKEEGKAVMTGHAVAIQDGNTIRSNRLTIYMSDGQAKVKE